MRYRIWVDHHYYETDRRTGTKFPRYARRAYDVKAENMSEALNRVRRFLIDMPGQWDEIVNVQILEEEDVNDALDMANDVLPLEGQEVTPYEYPDPPEMNV